MHEENDFAASRSKRFIVKSRQPASIVEADAPVEPLVLADARPRDAKQGAWKFCFGQAGSADDFDHLVAQEYIRVMKLK